MRPKLSEERGQALILAVAMMILVIGMASLAIDVGMAFHQKAKLQNAMDAAALAGGQRLPDNPGAAQSVAQETAVANGAIAGNLSITITTTYYASDTITVQATDRSPAYFSRVLNFAGFRMSAKAVSRAGSPSGMSGFLPLAVQQSVFQNLHTGQSATIKYDSQNQVNGNSLALALTGNTGNCQGSDTSGACRFRNNVISGTTGNYCIHGQETGGCTSTVSTEPGQMMGPLQQGLAARFSATSASCSSFGQVVSTDPTDSNELVMSNSCDPFQPYNVTTSERMVLIPVIDQLCNGSCNVHIVNFAVMFVNDITCQQGGGNGHGNGNGICTVTGTYAERVSNVRNYRYLGTFDPHSGLTFAALVQ